MFKWLNFQESSQTTGAIRAIINNLKGNNNSSNNNNNNDSNSGKNGKHGIFNSFLLKMNILGDDRKEIPRHKVSTNPFLRNNDKVYIYFFKKLSMKWKIKPHFFHRNNERIYKIFPELNQFTQSSRISKSNLFRTVMNNLFLERDE